MFKLLFNQIDRAEKYLTEYSFISLSVALQSTVAG